MSNEPGDAGRAMPWPASDVASVRFAVPGVASLWYGGGAVFATQRRAVDRAARDRFVVGYVSRDAPERRADAVDRVGTER